MLIQEAIKSGKPFSRIGYNIWIICLKEGRHTKFYAKYPGECNYNHKFTIEYADDILANDWEVKKEDKAH